MFKTIGTVAVIALAIAGLATAATASETYKFKARLTPGAEVPKPTGVPAMATGTFTATTVEPKTGPIHMTWKLTFTHLSGPGLQAHIHLGKPGKAGNVLVALCAPCKSGQTGKSVVARSVEDQLEKGLTYVNVHTKKNLGGEIRGQVKLVSGS
jgi:hypothetical protein